MKQGPINLKHLPLFFLGLIFCSIVGSIRLSAEPIDSLRTLIRNSPNDTNRVYALRDLGFLLAYEMPDSAVFYARSAYTLATQLKFERGIAAASFALGNYLDNAGDTENAIKTLLEARDRFQALNNQEYVGNAYNSIGICYYYQGDFAKALEYYQKAEIILKEHGHLFRQASVLNNIGIIYRNNRKYKKAIEVYYRAIEVKQQLNDSASLATTHYNMGQAYSYIDEFDSAMHHLNRSLELRPGKADSLAIAETSNAVGQVLSNTGRFEEAELEFKKAWEYFIHHKNRPDFASLSSYRADGFYRRGKIPEALEIVNLGIDNLPKEVSLVTEKGLYVVKSKVLASMGQFGEAYEIQSEVMDINETLRNEQQQELVEEMEAKYEARERQNQIDVQQIELEKSAREKNYLIVMVVLFVLLLIAAAGIAVQRIKRLKILNEKNKIISESLVEKEILLREIHHRVKNNLQVISSLLSIQSRDITDEKALIAVNESRNRVKSMAIIHQNLYQEDNLTGIDTSDFIEKLCRSLFQSYRVDENRISFKTRVDELILDVDSTIPIGLILNELISNSLKHAFPGDECGSIEVILQEQEKGLYLAVSDNGVGMTEPPINSGSFGMKMIKAFMRKLDAEMTVKKEAGFTVELMIRKYKLAK